MDPNEIIGTPREYEVWLSPNWDTADESTKSPGATRVSVRETRYKDGRVVRQVLDEKRQPITTRTLDETIDKAQETRWQKEKSEARTEAGGIKPTNVYIGTNPSTGKPSQVSEWPDGHKSYDDTQVPAAQNLTPAQQQQQAAAATTAQATAQGAVAENKEKQWNSDHGHGWVTNADRDKAARDEAAAARAEGNQQRIAASQEASNQIARDRLQFDRDKANLPDVKPVDIVVNGVHHTRVTSITPQGVTTIKNYGPDGKEEASIPGEGEASAGGPPFPEFIAGHTEQALTAYHTALYSDKSLTDAQRVQRFTQATTVANQVVQQAATEQRERESTRNADYNRSSSKLTYMQNGLGQALDFVSKINGTLPKGSDLGGKAFAAILGIQMLQLAQSGIDKVPTITNRDLSSNAALSAHNQTVSNLASSAASAEAQRQQQQAESTALAPANVQATTGAFQQATTNTGAGQPATNATPGARTQPPAAATTAAQNAATTGSPSPSLGQGQDLSSPNGTTMTGATQTGMPPAITAEQAAAYDRGGINPATGDISVQDTSTSSVGAPDVAQPGDPGYGEPTTGTTPVPPSQYGDSGDAQSMQSVSDWPALAGLGSPRANTSAQNQQSDMASDAARAAYIKATPPWRLDNSDLEWAHANGLIDDALSVAGRLAA